MANKLLYITVDTNGKNILAESNWNKDDIPITGESGLTVIRTSEGVASAIKAMIVEDGKARYVDNRYDSYAYGISTNASMAEGDIKICIEGNIENSAITWDVGTVLFVGQDGELIKYTDMDLNTAVYLIRVGIVVETEKLYVSLSESTKIN